MEHIFYRLIIWCSQKPLVGAAQPGAHEESPADERHTPSLPGGCACQRKPTTC